MTILITLTRPTLEEPLADYFALAADFITDLAPSSIET
jgi:hypothetical protein